MTAVFALRERRAAKADPLLIMVDERRLGLVAATLDQQVRDLGERLAVLRTAPGGRGRAAMDRDLEIHRLSARLRLLRRFGLDVCLGRMVPADGSDPVYVGRLGLSDDAGGQLLVDWRAPAAEPFFAATHAHPMGLASRRRYRWTQGLITDYWDEVFDPDGLQGHAALDDQSAFVASLGSSRTARMRDVLSTIAADQDAIIRAGSSGALVVDGGPGTGKTVVALHRAAYLLYADPRLRAGSGGVLVIGPHRPYLAYIADVLPSLGEEGVQTCTLPDLVAEGSVARPETDPELARLKASAALVEAIEPAVAFYEEPPKGRTMISTDVADVVLTTADWVEAFGAVDPATPHNEARDEILDALVDILLDRLAETDDELPLEPLRRSLRRAPELNEALDRAWTVVEPTDLVGDLWSVPAYLRRCAPWLTADQVRALQRDDPRAWTVADLPLLDAARSRLGDATASRRRQQREAADAAERAAMDDVVDRLLAADDDPEGSMQLLRRDSIRDALVDEAGLPSAEPDRLAGPFAHVIVDEAQELTDAEWLMVLRRCPSRSVTVVGDRAQARHEFADSWTERLARVGFDTVRQASLSINYRTPAEVMAAAEPVIRSVLPDANVPTSVRSNGVPVTYGATADLAPTVAGWLAEHDDGIACVIGAPGFAATSRVGSLRPEQTKGLEFDLVVLVDPERWGTGVENIVDRYVAMTRATQQLVVLTDR